MAHSLFAEKFASCTNTVSRQNRADLVPLEMKWACTRAGRGYVVHSREGVSLEQCLLFCRFADCCYLGLLEDQLSISWERMSYVSSSSPSSSSSSSAPPPSSWWWALVACARELKTLHPPRNLVTHPSGISTAQRIANITAQKKVTH